MDLEHERLAPGARRIQPALDLAAVALPVAVDRLDPRDLVGERGVERAQRSRRLRGTGRRAGLERHHLGQRRRRGADGDDEVPIPRRHGVPAREVVAIRGEAHGLPGAVERHAPELEAAVDRRREQERRAVGGRDDVRALAQRHVAVQRRIRLQLARREQVRAAAPARVRPVRREPPDPAPVAARAGTGRRARRSIGRRGSTTGRMKAASGPPAIFVTAPLATSTVKTDDRWSRSGCGAAVGRERDPRAVRAPGGLALGVGPLTSDRASPVVGIDEPQVRVAVVDEARAVELVAEPVDVAVVGQRHLAGLRRGGPAALLRLLRDRRPERARDDRQPAPVGRPRELVRAARQVGQPPGLAAVERQQEDLVAVEAVLRLLRPVGLLLDQQPAVGDEGERAPVGREARVAVRAAADGDLAGGRRAVGRGHPHRMAVAVVAHGRALDAERDVPAVGREHGVEGDGEAEQVVRARGTRHGLLR